MPILDLAHSGAPHLKGIRPLWRPRSSFEVVFVLLLLVSVLPLTAKYLPFTDMQGHLGHVGALVHANDPAANIDALYHVDVRLTPTVLYYFVTLTLGRLMPLWAANNLFLAVFVVAALPIAARFALRAFGRDQRYALIAFPLIYHRCVWYGFVGYAAAVPLMFVGLGLLARLLETSEQEHRVLARRAILLALLSLLITLAHFFAAGAFFGLALLMVVLRRPCPYRQAAAATALIPGAWFLFAWLRAGSASRPGLSAMNTLLEARQPLLENLSLFYGWSINGLANGVDDLALIGIALTLAMGALWVLRAGIASENEPWLWRRRRLVLFLAVVIVFFLLPVETNAWWAVNVRLVVPIWILTVIVLPRARRRAPAWLFAPAVVAAIGYGAYLTYDFHKWYMGVEMAGFDHAIEAIPPGQRVLVLSPPFHQEQHYRHYPNGYVGGYYVADRGGLVVPSLINPELWAWPRPLPASPPWGYARSFSWHAHGAGWDYFVVKQPAPPQSPIVDPLAQAPRNSVELVVQRGLWSVYRRKR